MASNLENKAKLSAEEPAKPVQVFRLSFPGKKEDADLRLALKKKDEAVTVLRKLPGGELVHVQQTKLNDNQTTTRTSSVFLKTDKN